MYTVILVGHCEKVVFSGLDGYCALDASKRQRSKTKLAVVLETPSGKRYSMAQQDVMMRRLKIAA